MRIALAGLILLASTSALAQDLRLGEEVLTSGQFCDSPDAVLAVMRERATHGDAAADRLFLSTPGCGRYAAEPMFLTDVMDLRPGARQILRMERNTGEVLYTAAPYHFRIISGS